MSALQKQKSDYFQQFNRRGGRNESGAKNRDGRIRGCGKEDRYGAGRDREHRASADVNELIGGALILLLQYAQSFVQAIVDFDTANADPSELAEGGAKGYLIRSNQALGKLISRIRSVNSTLFAVETMGSNDDSLKMLINGHLEDYLQESESPEYVAAIAHVIVIYIMLNKELPEKVRDAAGEYFTQAGEDETVLDGVIKLMPLQLVLPRESDCFSGEESWGKVRILMLIHQILHGIAVTRLLA